MKIATTHAGSLPRPTALNALFGARGRGELIDRGELDALVADATRQSVAKQVEVGLDHLTHLVFEHDISQILNRRAVLSDEELNLSLGREV